MAIRTRNKRDLSFSMASMSDLVFLLLIFFLITSTLISPTALKLMLPQSNNRTMEKPPKYTISINENYEYFLQGVKIPEELLEVKLGSLLQEHDEASVRLEANQNVSVQHIVNVIDAVNVINKQKNAKHKVILATSPKKD